MNINISGAGTVKNTAGNLTSDAVVLGAGTNETKVVTGITTDGVGSLTLTPTNGEPAITHVLASTGGLGGTLWETSSREYPGTAGYSMQFREGTFSTPFVYEDMVMNFGYNWNGSARVDATKPAQFMQLEHQYQLNNSSLSSMTVTEFHLNCVDTSGNVRRPFNFVSAWDGGFIQAGMSGSLLTFTDLAANVRLQGDYSAAYTTLSAGINSSTTTIPVTSGANISNGHYITILAEGSNTIETVLVTAGGGTASLTATRAQLGTTASAHASGAVVELNGAQIAAKSSFNILSDAASPFIVANRAGTTNILVVNRGGSTLTSSLAITAPAQNLLTLTNTIASGTAAIQLKADNGNKTATWNVDFGGNMVFTGAAVGSVFFDSKNALSFRNASFVTVYHNDGTNSCIGRANTFGSSTLRVYDGTASTGATTLLVQGGAAAADATTNKLFRINQGGGTTEIFSVDGSGVVRVGTDAILTRAGAAVLQHGAADAASPVAQTIRAQGSRSGTDSNVGGASLTIHPGTGTGTGTPASLVLQSPVSAASGTTAQTQTTGLSITNGCMVPRATTVASLPAAASNTDAMLIVTDASTTLVLGIGTTVSGGGANRVGVRSDGANWIYSF